MEDRLKHELSKEDLKYATLAFLYAFEPINYLKMGEVVSALGKHAEEDEQAKIIYHEGLERLIAFYEKQWKQFKEIKRTYFYRYQLASMHYAAGHLKWVIDFLSDFSDLESPEQLILADAYSDFGLFEDGFVIYKEILEESKSLRVVINAFHCLILSEKVAEAKLYHLLFNRLAIGNEGYQNNLDILEKQQKEMTEWKTDNGLKKNEELIKLKEKKDQKIFIIDFNSEAFEEISDREINTIMELFARENETKVYQLENRRYQLLVEANNKAPSFNYFIKTPIIEEL